MYKWSGLLLCRRTDGYFQYMILGQLFTYMIYLTVSEHRYLFKGIKGRLKVLSREFYKFVSHPYTVGFTLLSDQKYFTKMWL